MMERQPKAPAAALNTYFLAAISGRLLPMNLAG